MTDETSALKALHTSLIDSRNGYQEALQDAERNGMTVLFRDMIALREKHADEIGVCLRGLGEPVDDSGSLLSTVHRTIMSVRSLFGGLDESVLPGLIDGEKRTLRYYDDALAGALPTATIRDVLLRQRAVVAERIEAMEARRAAAG